MGSATLEPIHYGTLTNSDDLRHQINFGGGCALCRRVTPDSLALNYSSGAGKIGFKVEATTGYCGFNKGNKFYALWVMIAAGILAVLGWAAIIITCIIPSQRVRVCTT